MNLRVLVLLVAWIAICSLAFFFFIFRYGFGGEARTQSSLTFLPVTEPGIKDLWVSQNGLVTVRQEDWKVEISLRRPNSAGPERREVDLQKWVKLIPQSEFQQPNSAESSPPTYTIARDISKIAFTTGNIIALKSLVDDTEQSFRYQKVVKYPGISALAFTGDMLAVLYTNSMLEFRNTVDLGVIKEIGTGLRKPDVLWGNNRNLVVVSFTDSKLQNYATYEVGQFMYAPDKENEYSFSITSLNSFTVDFYYNHVATSIGSSEVQIDGAKFTAPGRVRALALYDTDNLLAAGDFEHVYLIQRLNGTVKPVIAAPQGTRLLATNQKILAFVIGDNLHYTWEFPSDALFSSSTTSASTFSPRIRYWTAIIVWIIAILVAILLTRYYLRKQYERPEITSDEPASMPASEPVTQPLPEPPAELVEACASRQCVLYAGAGLSAQAGFPTWNKFVHRLLNWAIENGYLDRHVVESYQAEINAGATDSVADTIISKLPPDGRNELNAFMREVFLQRVDLPAAHNLLKDLNFSAILTTNFDALLERTFTAQRGRSVGAFLPFTYAHTDHLLSALTTREFFILKLYGTLDEPKTVLVAPAQFEEAITANREFSEFMETLFFSRTLFFVGASLEGIEAYLKSITLPRTTNRTHYALVAVTDNIWRAKADTLERRYGIKVLPYSPTRGFPEFVKFLEKLKAQVQTRATRVVQGDRKTARLKKLVLQNIGPFDSLELDLNDEWNILLGDNGVGKSTILKAISVAIVGEKAQPYAGRLIKSGSSTESFIILETDQDTKYKTTLKRGRGIYEDAEVISTQARVLEAEGWLALGFPPLRMTNWQRISGPDPDPPTTSRPSPDDLLPLITGEPDPRLDKLKQWLVNIDYWNKKDPTNARYAGLTDKLFKLINLLIKPLIIEFKGIGRDGRIMIETAHDGPVPIEAISQGLSSLIGWVGVLMQRLYEIHDKDPLDQYALVLMDELDAHMHPAWQQALVPRLQEIFRNTQFIATTHSPLVAMGMSPKQVLRLIRNDDGVIEQIEVEEDMTFGRADQVLTSDLFSVASARDLHTQKMIDRYSDLAARDDEALSAPDRAELAKLAQQLKIRMPSPAERKEARIAYEWINKALKEQIDSLPREEQEKVIAEMKVQLQEIVTGSWRPQ